MVDDHTCVVAAENGRLDILTTDPDYLMFVTCHICGIVLFPRFLSHSPFRLRRTVVLEERIVSEEYAKQVDPPWVNSCFTCRAMKMLWSNPPTDDRDIYQFESDMRRHFKDHGVNMGSWLRARRGGEPDPVPF